MLKTKRQKDGFSKSNVMWGLLCCSASCDAANITSEFSLISWNLHAPAHAAREIRHWPLQSTAKARNNRRELSGLAFFLCALFNHNLKTHHDANQLINVLNDDMTIGVVCGGHLKCPLNFV